MSKQTKTVLLFLILYGTMLLFGYAENLRGVSYPLIKTEFGVSYEQQGVMVSVLSLSYMLFCLTGGIILGRFGVKKAFAAGYIVLILGLAGTFLMPGFLSVAAALFFVFAGFGLFEVSLNALATQVFTARAALLMSLLHFFYGAGSSLSPRIAGSLAASLGWRNMYILTIPLALVFFIPSLFARFPAIEDEHGKTNGKKTGFFTALKTPIVWNFSVTLGLMVAIETCSVNWAGLYFQDVYQLDPRTSGAAFVSNFFILFTVSRLLSGFAIEKIGYMKSLFIAAIMTFLVFIIGFGLGEKGVYILPGLGIFVAIFWPTILARAMGHFRNDAPVMTSAIIVIAGALNSLIQLLIGIINRLVGPAWGYRSCLFYSVLVIITLVVLSRRLRHPYVPAPGRSAAAIAIIAVSLAGCAGPHRESPRIVPEAGVSVPVVKSIAWLGEERFVSVSDDGVHWVWDIYSGLISASTDSAGFTQTENDISLPVYNSDKRMYLLPAEDGAVRLMDTDSGKELARYYGFASAENRDPEWICIVPGGIYSASLGVSSSGGSACLAAETGAPDSRLYRRYNLEQLSAALFRPDLFREILAAARTGGKVSDTSEPIISLFSDDNLPPQLSLSFDNTEPTLSIKITGEKGGVGRVALYGRLDGTDIPAGFYDTERAAEKKYTENGRSCYELNIALGDPLIIPYRELEVSAFNKFNTIESKRCRITIPQAPDSAAETAPNETPPSPPRTLRALLAAGDGESPESHIFAMGEALSIQTDGTLFDNTEIKYISGGDLSREHFIQSLGELSKLTVQNDVLVLGIKAGARSDSQGNLRILAVKTGAENTGRETETEISADDILEQVLGLSRGAFLFLLDLESAGPEEKMAAALLRFRQRLGPKALLAAFGPPGREDSLFGSAADLLNGGHSGGGGAFSEDRYMSVTDLIGGTAHNMEQVISFNPGEDFKIADLFLNAGELKFQTMSSGMLKIDRVDKDPIPLAFGNTMIRVLPPGNYIIDMIYRNGYRETKTAELRRKGSVWVIFTYTPALLNGDLSKLPSLGINLSELNPVNYEKINREAMEGMGMAPYYVAFLAGEKSYKDGDYTRALAEYTHSISLKSDYADAYASRGNTRRKTGDLSRAIEDYTRAINLNKNYAEVYNYRGYVYAQTGETAKAIGDYTQAIRNKSGYTDAYFNRAYAYAKQGNWDLAIADYTQVIKAEPSNGIAYRERGNAWDKKGDKAKADADYSTAAKLNAR